MGIWPNPQLNHKTKNFPVNFPKNNCPEIIYNIPILHLNINPKKNSNIFYNLILCHHTQ